MKDLSLENFFSASVNIVVDKLIAFWSCTFALISLMLLRQFSFQGLLLILHCWVDKWRVNLLFFFRFPTLFLFDILSLLCLQFCFCTVFLLTEFFMLYIFRLMVSISWWLADTLMLLSRFFLSFFKKLTSDKVLLRFCCVFVMMCWTKCYYIGLSKRYYRCVMLGWILTTVLAALCCFSCKSVS